MNLNLEPIYKSYDSFSINIYKKGHFREIAKEGVKMPLLNHDINLQEKKVVIADVDDTICETCHVISPEMAGQISAMIREGYVFAFISGTKQSYLLEMISSQLKEQHFLLATTGTQCLEAHPEPKLVYNHTLQEEEKKEIMEALEKLTAKFNIQTLTTTEDQIQDRESQITLSAIGRKAPLELKKQHDPDGSKRKVWVEFLKTVLDQHKYEMNIAGTTSIDITRKGMDKEWGIREFARYYGIPLHSIIFFGDKIHPGGNDYPATKIVDCMAVKNPAETLQKLQQLQKINNLNLEDQDLAR